MEREILTYDDLLDFDVELVLRLWNEYCIDINNRDDMIFENDEEFMNDYSPLEVAQKVYYGDYHYNDSWITLNGRNNFQSFSFTSELYEYLPLQEMIDYYNEEDCLTNWEEITQ